MSSDNQVISFMTPGDLIALMRATAGISVGESAVIDGQPVIHASLKLVNARTGQEVPGGLPFSVVQFKASQEQGYSNIAIGTVVPVAELDVTLPHDYFNLCNQRFRFTRAFPISPGAFVLQMDLMLRHATREYVKFAFGLWGTLFSHILFELVGRGRESLVAAAEAYALAHTDFAQHVVAPEALPVMDVAEPALVLDTQAEPPAPEDVEVVAEAAPASVVEDEAPLVLVSEDGVAHDASVLDDVPAVVTDAAQAEAVVTAAEEAPAEAAKAEEEIVAASAETPAETPVTVEETQIVESPASEQPAEAAAEPREVTA